MTNPKIGDTVYAMCHSDRNAYITRGIAVLILKSVNSETIYEIVDDNGEHKFLKADCIFATELEALAAADAAINQ